MSTTTVNVSIGIGEVGRCSLHASCRVRLPCLPSLGIFPCLESQITNLDRIGLGSGAALLVAAALAGGVLEGLTRISWEKYCLCRWWPMPKGTLERLTTENLPLYERGVQSSYKFATFYANFAFATLLLLVSRVLHGPLWSTANFILVLAAVILLIASTVQWSYFVNYQTNVFGGTEDVEERSAAGDEGNVHQIGTEREGR